jgi:hypothetical protein
MIVPYDGGVQQQNQRQSAHAQMTGDHTADIICRVGDSWVHGELLGNWVVIGEGYLKKRFVLKWVFRRPL